MANGSGRSRNAATTRLTGRPRGSVTGNGVMIEPEILQSKTIPEMVRHRVRLTPDALSHETQVDGAWQGTTYGEFGQQIEHAALGFYALGLRHKDNIAIWGDTMPEWTVLDLGAMAVGANVSGVYQTTTPDNVVFILNDAKTKYLCVDCEERLQQALELLDQVPTVEKIVTWQPGPKPTDDRVLTMSELDAMGAQQKAQQPELYDQLIDGIDPDDLAMLIYTSGTTGKPKGVMLSHLNCLTQSQGVHDNDFMHPGDRLVSFLPMSHVAEHAAQFLGRVFGGLETVFCPDMQKIGEVIREKPPSLLLAVPRVYEKIHQRVVSQVESAPPNKQKLFRWAIDQGRAVADLKREGKPVPMGLSIKHAIADRLVLSKVRQAFGGEIRIMVSSAAPIDPEIIHFFSALGVIFLEAYGLSECGGACTANKPDANKIGTVGRAMKGFEVKTAEDGEVLVRGNGVFMGYLNRPDATAETKDDEGWLHTGDIGVIDEDGFLKITDRKKNLLITAGGKNVAPAHIETLIKRENIISQVVVIGDRKPYLTALITLNSEVVNDEGIDAETIEARVAKAVAEANEQLPRYEQVKKFQVLDDEFSVESGEMTPTMKVKRNVVMDRHKDAIAGMYTD